MTQAPGTTGQTAMFGRQSMAAVAGVAVAAIIVVAVSRGLYAGIDAGWWWWCSGAAVLALAAALLTCLGAHGWKHPARWGALMGALLFVLFAGPRNGFAFAVISLCALAAVPERLCAGVAGTGIRLVVGLAIMSAVIGWLLPFPIHLAWVYLSAAGLLCVLRRRALGTQLASLRLSWLVLEREGGVWLSFVVAVTCIAGLGLWLPSLNYDDNTTHLALPYQLLADGYYQLNVSGQIWALAPWSNNVLNAIAALLVGEEARASLNLVWLLLGINGAWRLATALGASTRAALAAAAMFAGMPLTGYFTTTMQMDGPSAAVLLQFAALLVSGGRALPPVFVAGAVLGLLAGLKASNGIYACPAILVLAWHALRDRRPGWLAAFVGIGLLVGGSSYFYAGWVTGNPVFPLFNATFKSPYFPLIDFIDNHWMAGVSWRTPWDVTFHTDRYGEHYPGAFGIALLALLPALALESMRHRASRLVVAWFAATALVLFLQVQYVRYLYPALAVLGVVGVVGLARLVPARMFGVLLVALVVANVALVPTTVWFLRGTAWRELAQHGPRARAVIESEASPERVTLRAIFAASPKACVVMTDKASPFTASSAGRAVSVKKIHDQRVGRAAAWANEDATGGRWTQLMDALGTSHVMTSPTPVPALQAAMAARGFEVISSTGNVRVWASPDARRRDCRGGLRHVRDEARRHFQVWEGE